MLQTKANSNLNKWYSTAIVLMPILNIYSAGISSLGVGDVFGVIMIVFLLINDRGKIKFNERKYSQFAFYGIILSLVLTFIISNYSFAQFILKCMRFIIYTILVVCYGRDKFDDEFGFGLYIKISVIAACYLIIQYLFKTIFSISLPITVPYLKLLYSDATGATYNEQLLQMYSIFGYRAPGFFKEPSHFCQYVVPAVALLLFRSSRDAKRNVAIVIISIAVILSYSAIGYISLMATIVIWFVYTFNSRKIINNLFFLVVGSAALIFLSIKSGALSSALDRVQTINYTHAATGNMRLLRGFYVYKEAPLFCKIFGIGFGNYSAFVDKFSIQTFFDTKLDKYSEYMSAISCVLLNTGAIGLILYIRAIFDVFMRTKLVQKVIFVSFIIVIISTSSFFSASYVLYMTLIVASIDENKDEHRPILP